MAQSEVKPTPTSVPDGARVAGWMRLAAVAVTVTVCTAALLDYLAVDHVEDKYFHGAEAIDMTGRQRMLATQLLLAAGEGDPVGAREHAEVLDTERRRLEALPMFAALDPPKPVAVLQAAAAGNLQSLRVAVPPYVQAMDRAAQELRQGMQAEMAAGERQHALSMAALAGAVTLLCLVLGETLARRLRRLYDRQRALHAELAQLALVAERTHNGVVFSDAQGRIQWVNAGFTRLTGYDAEDAIGRRPSELVQFDGTDQATVQRIRAALSEQRPVQVEILNRGKHGAVYWQQLDIQPLADDEGHCTGFVAVQTDISALVAERERLAAVLQALPAGVVQFDVEGAVVDLNQAACAALGESRAHWVGRVPEDGRWHAMSEDGQLGAPQPHPARQVLFGGPAVHGRLLGRLRADSLQVLRLNVEPLHDAAGGVAGAVASFFDITEHSAQRRLLALTVEAARLGTWDWHVPSGNVRVNAQWWQMLGMAPKALPETLQTWQSLCHPEDLPGVLAMLRRHLQDSTQPYRCEFRVRHASGRWLWVMAAGAVIERDASGKPLRLAGVHLDIDARKQSEQQLQVAALTDALTGLPNRSALVQRLGQCASADWHRSGTCYALLFLDFDRFKQVNDSLGHEIGDELLRQIAERLRSALRPGDELARLDPAAQHAMRLGGDEFVVLLERLHAPEEAERVAQRLLQVLAQPYPVGGHVVHSSASIGIVTSNRAKTDPAHLLRDADTAMYEAKRRGRGRAVVFSPDMQERVREALDLETELRTALVDPDAQLSLAYQPIVSLLDGELVGVEALLRWQHPQRGAVPPSLFVPVAEEAGLIGPMTEWVLQRACADAAVWRRQLGQRAPTTVSVNLSRAHIRAGGVVMAVQAALTTHGLSPQALRLEVTESMAMDDEAVAAKLTRLREMGVSVALDDFGTGHSSLAALDRLPLDAVKIDRSFVQRITDSSYQRALVGAVVQVAKALRLQVVAEGVETEAQAQVLRAAGCPLAQGWLFGRPMPAAALMQQLKEPAVE